MDSRIGRFSYPYHMVGVLMKRDDGDRQGAVKQGSRLGWLRFRRCQSLTFSTHAVSQKSRDILFTLRFIAPK